MSKKYLIKYACKSTAFSKKIIFALHFFTENMENSLINFEIFTSAKRNLIITL